MSSQSASPVFTVRRQDPELIHPALPTPREHKLLSDIDNQGGLRIQVLVFQFYRHSNPITMSGGAAGRDPVMVIREALAKTLVFYYPLAGRLREEGPDRKLIVDCTGGDSDSGVIFIEADADVELQQFGDQIQQPFPFQDDFLYDDVPGSSGMLGCPLVLIQVTRLKCGGFIFGIRLNHLMSDAGGVAQFMIALGETARGASAPSTLPVWQRYLLNARNPPHVTCTHPEYDDGRVISDSSDEIPLEAMVHQSFIVSAAEISNLRRLIPPYLRSCSTFQLLAACLWRCRTIAIKPDVNEIVRVLCIVNARSRFNPPLPVGYYGNAIAFPAAVSTAGELCRNPLGYALQLVMKTIFKVNEEYMKSAADLMVIQRRPPFVGGVKTWFVSDTRRAGFENVDFGWGKPIFGTPGGGPVSFCIATENRKGEKGIGFNIKLPSPSMERFKRELQMILLSSEDNYQPGINSAL